MGVAEIQFRRTGSVSGHLFPNIGEHLANFHQHWPILAILLSMSANTFADALANFWPNLANIDQQMGKRQHLRSTLSCIFAKLGQLRRNHIQHQPEMADSRLRRNCWATV